MDSPERNRRFAEVLGAPFPLLSDPGKQVARAYDVLGFAGLMAKRRTFIIGPDGTIRAIIRAVKPWSHGAQVREALRLVA